MTRHFPDRFSWGTATAAHQIEGGNWNNDWWAFEHAAGTPCAEPSGDACDSYHRYFDDAQLVADMGLDNYRFSIEWSRIEPEPGEFSQASIDHYRRVCESLRSRDVDPVVTFHHFTSPRWVADKGGWINPETADRFAAFCERAGGALGDLMVRACTINEPNIVAMCGYRLGIFPPGHVDDGELAACNEVFIDAHRKAVQAIRSTAPGIPVGVTLSLADWQAVDGGDARRDEMRAEMDDVFLDATGGDDFIGVQTYTRHRIGPEGMRGGEEGVEILPMGYEYYPEALANVLRYVWDYTGGAVPLLVTENGIGTDDDSQRIGYLRTALSGVLDCIDEGVDVQGYTCWSLLDNFEWAFGYRPRFGLVEVDRATFRRTPKPSAAWYGQIARTNALPD